MRRWQTTKGLAGYKSTTLPRCDLFTSRRHINSHNCRSSNRGRSSDLVLLSQKNIIKKVNMSGIAYRVEQAENRLAETMWTRLVRYQRHGQNINDLLFSGSDNLIHSATLAAKVNETDVARLIGRREKCKLAIYTITRIIVFRAILAKLNLSAVFQNAFLKFARRIVQEIPKQNCMDTSENGITSMRLEMVFARMAGMTANSGLQCEPMTKESIKKIIREAQDSMNHLLSKCHLLRNYLD